MNCRKNGKIIIKMIENEDVETMANDRRIDTKMNKKKNLIKEILSFPEFHLNSSSGQ